MTKLNKFLRNYINAYNELQEVNQKLNEKINEIHTFDDENKIPITKTPINKIRSKLQKECHDLKLLKKEKDLKFTESYLKLTINIINGEFTKKSIRPIK